MRAIQARIGRDAGVGFLMLALMGGAMASGPIVDFAWDAQGQFVHKTEVPAGKFVELCGPLKAGQKVAWSFQAGAPMNFNIHYHLGPDVVYPTKLSAVTLAAQSLAVQKEQVYCWMWSNKTAAAATLDVLLKLER